MRAEQVEVAAGELVADDLYAFGDTITVNGTVKGDLICAGRHVRINGTIEGDLIAAAQAVEIEGTVGDDVRIAGQILRVGERAAIGDDVLAAGFSLETLPGAENHGTLHFAGYQAQLGGGVGENVKVAAQALELRGRVGGSVEAGVEGGAGPSPVVFLPAAPIGAPAVMGGLSVADSASIEGDLHYTSSAEARIGEGARIGGAVTRSEPETPPPPVEAETEAEPEKPEPRVLRHLRRLLAIGLVGLVLVLLLPSWVSRLSDRLREHPFSSFAWGLAGVVGLAAGSGFALLLAVVLAVALIVVKLGGLSVAVVLLGLVLSGVQALALIAGWFYLAQIVFAVTVGRWLLLRALRRDPAPLLASLLLGLLLFFLVRLIPWLGWLFGIVVALVGLGCAVSWLFGLLSKSPGPMPLQTSGGTDG